MKKCLLDTNILSYFLRGNPVIVEKFGLYRQHYSYLSFSIFTYYEIKSGLLYKDAYKQMQRFENLAAASEIISYDKAIAAIPIIAVTDLALPEAAEKCSIVGISEYVSKPIRLKRLAEIVWQFCHQDEESR